MKKEEILAVFERCGHGKLGDDLSYKLWIKGFGETCDEETLEGFLLTYDFSDVPSILVDEFVFHFQIYQTVVRSFDMNFPFLYL